MRVFVTGASGYIGGSVANALVERGDEVVGLTRSAERAKALEKLGIEPVVGALGAWELLVEQARAADAVVAAADADDAYAASALLTGLRGSGKRLVHTSGTSIVGDMAAGEPSDLVHTEDGHLNARSRFEKAGRVAIDRAVLDAAKDGVHAIVVVPPMIYGEGTGLHTESIQVPGLIRVSRATGAGVHVGRGLNRWANVHIADLVDLYLLALDRAPSCSFFFAENGEASLMEIAAAISRMLGFGGRTQALTLAEALEHWPPAAVHYSLASNVRVSAAKARAMLGWRPRYTSIVEE
ncbi:MAG: NAD-dependent epimerase/dehydratase family protein, partial [Geminicoccales bacterium]